VLVYLNNNIDEVREAYQEPKLGELRLYLPEKIIDVTPRMGRAIIFKSEVVEHEVRPTSGFDRYAVTVWFNQVCNRPARIPQTIPENYSIFVGIPAYRDSELVATVTSLVS